MLKETNSVLYWRSLLTETLPYEVPVIFSNELLYASLVKPSTDPDVRKIVDCIRTKHNKYTIPYSYVISKDDSRSTTLGIIHPNQQMAMAEFYELYKQSLVDYCSNSEISLRRPSGDMPFFANNELSDEESLKQGIPHIQPEDGQIDVSRMTSYFTYERYNLLGKFVEAKEFRELEKNFRFLRTLDVSKCFFHIYTHSVTWAVKGKQYSKAQSDTYSFEAQFDKLMQRANYNETNGIVIGPEISRIFAEIIFQEIDRATVNALQPRQHNSDFAIRRYVDDYYIFASTEEMLDAATSVLESELERFKLFLNTEKTVTHGRPFVSKISMARSELKALISEMDTCLDGLAGDQDAAKTRKQARELKRLALDIRLISERYAVTLNSLSGWLLATLRGLLRRSIAAIKFASDDTKGQAATEMAADLLEIVFYIAALDLRVRTTYSLCQMAVVIDELKTAGTSDSYDQLSHFFKQELSSLIAALLRRTYGAREDGIVELSNLMVIAAQYYSADFFDSDGPRKALEYVLADQLPSYFSYVTAKFCLLKDKAKYAAELQKLNSDVRTRLNADAEQLGTSSELYLLACDYLSSPDVSETDKRSLVQSICGGQPAKATVTEASKYLGFVDWNGVRIVHVLGRRELRPVYSWS
jgi:hypothetical protein